MTQETITHKLTMTDRSCLTMTGVSEVISFDDSAVELQTCMGSLTVHGEELQLKNLSVEGGQVEIRGNIAALIYQSSQSSGGSWLSRLLR